MAEHRLNLDEIAHQVDIVTVINHYVPLTKKGRNYVGLCPFHDDSNPSMNVNPEKRIYKCFSCGAAGNAFTFIQNFEKIPFMDAVRKVADICNITLPEHSFQEKKSRYNESQLTMIKALDAATQFYHYSLSTQEGKAAEDYLLSRGLTPQLINDFQLGYAPSDSQKTASFLLGAGHQADALVASAMFYETASQQLQDYQRGRVIFPIHDADGHTVGFSGRQLIANPNESKYTNTSESLVFQKGRILFNLHQALLTAKKDGYLYLVEGFMDAITLHRVGLTSVVATMGTALTKEHIAFLASLRVEIRLALDFDRAGLAAMQKSLLALLEAGVKTRVVQPLEVDDDADELYAKQGTDAVKKVYTTLIDPVQFLMYFYGQTTNFGNYESRRKYADLVMRLIAHYVSDPLTRDYYTSEVSRKSGFSTESLVTTYLTQERQKKRTITRPLEEFAYATVKEDLKYYQQIERELIKCMLINRSLIDPIQKEFSFGFMDDVAAKLAFYIYESVDGDPLEIDQLMTTLNDDRVKRFLGELIGQERVVYNDETIKNLIANHTKSLQLTNEIDALQKEQLESKDPQRHKEIWKRLTELQYQLRRVRKN